MKWGSFFPELETSEIGFEMVCLQNLEALVLVGRLLDLGCLSSPAPATF